MEEEVSRRVQARSGGEVEGSYQVGGGSASGLNRGVKEGGVKRKAEDQGDEERASDDKTRGEALTSTK